MKTLYKSSRLIAAAIVGTVVLSAGTAMAIAKDTTSCRECPDHQARANVEDMGRFEVTPNSVKFVAPNAMIGRFVVTERSAVFIPSAEKVAA